MWIILIRIRVSEFVNPGSKVDIQWSIRILRFLVLLDSVDAADCFHDTLGLTRNYQKTIDTN